MTKIPLLVQDEREPISIRSQREYIEAEAMRLGIGFSAQRNNRFWFYFNVSEKRAAVYDAQYARNLIEEVKIKNVLTWIDETSRALTNALALAKGHKDHRSVGTCNDG